jgi:hypothetical protein
VIGADVPDADVVAPDDQEMIRMLGLLVFLFILFILRPFVDG